MKEFYRKVPTLANDLEGLFNSIMKGDVSEPWGRSVNDSIVELQKELQSTMEVEVNYKTVIRLIIQHTLVFPMFKKAFEEVDVFSKNIIASKIEDILNLIPRDHLRREGLFSSVNDEIEEFYGEILDAKNDTKDPEGEVMKCMNDFYQKFFSAFSIAEADVFGVVYTPPEIVDFMVSGVQDLLKKNFGESLGSDKVEIIDPFAGTGSFMLSMLKAVPKDECQLLYHKFQGFEIDIFSYYVATLNLEKEYQKRTGEYESFHGIKLADTFEELK